MIKNDIIMKLKPFLLILAALLCGVIIGYYIGKHSKTTKPKEETTTITEAEPVNLPVYDGPFGLDMGLSLDDVKQICEIEHIDNDAYEITPPQKNDLFKTYIVWIDSEYGLHGIRAITERIHANDHGAELKSRFENIVESIESKYGKYKRTDKNSNNRLFREPQYFMYTLREGSRELSAVWAKRYQSQLPDNIAGIAIEVVAENAFPNVGYVTLEYGFSNSDAVKAKADTVF
jgi:hypothetical protein